MSAGGATLRLVPVDGGTPFVLTTLSEADGSFVFREVAARVSYSLGVVVGTCKTRVPGQVKLVPGQVKNIEVGVPACQ